MNCIDLRMLYTIGDWQYFNITISDYAWTEQQFIQLVPTFAYVYFKGVSAPLELICYLGPHAWYIKENEIKQARQKRKKE